MPQQVAVQMRRRLSRSQPDLMIGVMAHSRRERHRDVGTTRREIEDEPPSLDRVFRLSDEDRQEIARCLRYIDEARRAIESQQNPENREIIRELRASADKIFALINDLDEIGHP